MNIRYVSLTYTNDNKKYVVYIVMINMCYWLSFFNPHFFVSLNSRTTLQASTDATSFFFLINKGIDFIVQLVLQILICVFTSKNNTNKNI